MWCHLDWPDATTEAEDVKNMEEFDGYLESLTQDLFPDLSARAVFIVITQPSTLRLKKLERKKAASWMRGSPRWDKDLQNQMNHALKETATADVLLIDASVCSQE